MGMTETAEYLQHRDDWDHWKDKIEQLNRRDRTHWLRLMEENYALLANVVVLNSKMHTKK